MTEEETPQIMIPKDSSAGLVKIHSLRSAPLILLRALQDNEEGLLPDTIPEF